MKFYLSLFLILGGLLAGYSALALSEVDVVFPIERLGNCESEQECISYCDDPAHFDACIAFVEEYNLLSPEELARTKELKKFQEGVGEGPGGCTSQVECETYCNDVSNIEECLDFAEQHNLMDEEHLEEARMIAKALREGAQLPGGCTSEATCEAYCENPNNMRECVAFAEAAGFMSPEELREVKQVLKALDAGIPFPGNCRGEDECEAYCDDFNHMEECVEFGIAAGFIPPEEAEQVRRMIPLMRAGKMPEACRGGREECEAYCADEANTEECTTFFVEAGFMTAEQAKMFRETGGKGPGDCKGREECEAFCNNPANQEVCFEFGTQHGFISEEELHNIEQGSKRFEEGFAGAPPEVEECLKEKLGVDVLLKIEAGTFLPTPELGEHMRGCFEDSFPRPEGGEFGPPPGFERGEEGFFPGEFEHEQDGQFPGGPESGFIPEEFQHLLPNGVEGFTPKDIEDRIRREQEEQFLQEGFFPGPEGDFIPEEFQQFVPSDEFSPDGTTFEQHQVSPDGDALLRQEEELFLQQQLEEQVHQEEQLIEPAPPTIQDATQGNILEAAIGVFLRLIPR